MGSGVPRSLTRFSPLRGFDRYPRSLLPIRSKTIKTKLKEGVKLVAHFAVRSQIGSAHRVIEFGRMKRIAAKQTRGPRTVLAETRRQEIAEAMRSTGSVTVAEVESRFGVSPMTARRDLDELERRGLVRRTHGGAVLPTAPAHEDSFARRMKVAMAAKTALAAAAVERLTPRETVSWTP